MRIVCIVFALVFVACASDQETGASQETAIRSYLTRGYMATLPLADSLGGGLYRVLENDRDGRSSEPSAGAGSRVSFFFDGYLFHSALDLNPGLETLPAPFYSNRTETIGALGVDWESGPAVATLGGGGLLEGLDRGMAGVHRGDSVLIFMISDRGYGSKGMAVVPDNTPLAFRVYVNDVI